jgi:hypothetical protein
MSTREREKPDYEKQFTTVDECDEEIQNHKDLIVRKVKERFQTQDNKRDAMRGYNDVLKEIEEELDFSTGVIDELHRHKKLLLATEEAGLNKNGKLQSV